MSQSSTTALIDLGNTSVRDRLNAIISDVEKDEDSSPEKREWKVFINPMNDASVSKKLKSDDDQVKTDRIPSIAFNRMLTRTIIPKELGDYTPRTILSKQLSNSYHQTISSLLKLSNKEMLSMRDFVERKHNGKVNLSQFVELMIYHTTMYKFFNKKDDLLHCIQQLFNIIDINSDGHICWSEFTSYLGM